MSLKFFRPWEDNDEDSKSQAMTHRHRFAADASETVVQPQVHSDEINQEKQRADPSISPFTSLTQECFMRLALSTGKSNNDADFHGDKSAQQLSSYIDITWKGSCSTGPRSDGSEAKCPCNNSREDLGLTKELTQESPMTCYQSKSHSASSGPSNPTAENNSCANVILNMTAKPGETLSIAKDNEKLEDSAGLAKSIDLQSGHLSFEHKDFEQEIAASSNIDGQECLATSKPFMGTACKTALSRPSTWRVHERNHTRSRSFQCNICGKTFTRSYHLHKHERVHTGIKPFKCRFCKKSFAQSGQVHIHERTHTELKPFKCSLCDKAFIQSGCLLMHERIHTGLKPFKCKTCDKMFTQSSNLHRHERTHTGSKPFKCSVCKKAFTDSSNLLVHERIHTGLKPFQCKTCNKAFTHSGNLKVHLRTHSGSKPFQCTVCGKYFTQSNNLRKHERIHTRCYPSQ